MLLCSKKLMADIDRLRHIKAVVFEKPVCSAFVKAILDVDTDRAKELYQRIKDKYPIRLTRDLSTAKRWVREQCLGTTRYGMLASSGARQAFHTQRGIALIYVFVPIVLMALAILFTALFPMEQREFGIIKKEIARRKGEDSSAPTAEERKICEKVTGFDFDKLWNKDNALKF